MWSESGLEDQVRAVNRPAPFTRPSFVVVVVVGRRHRLIHPSLDPARAPSSPRPHRSRKAYRPTTTTAAAPRDRPSGGGPFIHKNIPTTILHPDRRAVRACRRPLHSIHTYPHTRIHAYTHSRIRTLTHTHTYIHAGSSARARRYTRSRALGFLEWGKRARQLQQQQQTTTTTTTTHTQTHRPRSSTVTHALWCHTTHTRVNCSASSIFSTHTYP